MLGHEVLYNYSAKKISRWALRQPLAIEYMLASCSPGITVECADPLKHTLSLSGGHMVERVGFLEIQRDVIVLQIVQGRLVHFEEV